jgi:hypothetical protein
VKYTCFKKCGVEVITLGDLYAHYKAEPTHHRLYGANPEYRERQNKRGKTDADRQKLREYKRAQRAAAKAEAKANGRVVGKHLSVVGNKGRKSNMAILKVQLQNAINEAAQKIEKLQFAQQLLEKGRLEA